MILRYAAAAAELARVFPIVTEGGPPSVTGSSRYALKARFDDGSWLVLMLRSDGTVLSRSNYDYTTACFPAADPLGL